MALLERFDILMTIITIIVTHIHVVIIILKNSSNVASLAEARLSYSKDTTVQRPRQQFGVGGARLSTPHIASRIHALGVASRIHARITQIFFSVNSILRSG